MIVERVMFLSDDASRVLLAGGKDDYINASHIGVRLLPTVSLVILWLEYTKYCHSGFCQITVPSSTHGRQLYLSRGHNSKQVYLLELHTDQTRTIIVAVTYFL